MTQSHDYALDAATCEQARLSRDARFDGRFFVAVLTTGIYCRPVCPVKPPRPENRVFYATAAAAAEAGFRPCLRCRPETAPGTPAWSGTNATVTRALRLISGGALDATSIDQFATRLGVGSRHLSRLFQKHLGASPVAIARTRRLHYAKKLLDETDLAMADLALAAGYRSVRRFNDEFRRGYGCAPTALRRRGTLPARPDGGYQIALDYRPPYDWQGVLQFLAGRATPGVEWVSGEEYGRTLQFGGAAGTLTVRPAPRKNRLICVLHISEPCFLVEAIERVKRMFDLGADPGEINDLLGRDKALGPLVAASPGVRIPGSWDGFETTVRAIIGQQVSVSAATTTCGRLAARYGTRSGAQPGDGARSALLFPEPEQLADLPVDGVGMPRSKASAIRDLARLVCRGEDCFERGTEPHELKQFLLSVKGIGPWTAEYIAMRYLGEPDAFPHPDLVLMAAAGRVLRLPGNGSRQVAAHLMERAQRWRPWRAYAALHLWRAMA